MDWFNQFARNLGQSNAPFGFAPQGVAPSQEIDPAYQAGMGMIGDVGMRMLSNVRRNPLEAFGQSYSEAQDNARSQNKETFMAQQMMMDAEEKKKERARQQQEQQQRDDFLATLPGDVQMKARSVPGFLEEYVKATTPEFQTQEGVNMYGTPLWGKDGKPYYPTKDGKFISPDAGTELFDPYATSYSKSRGAKQGGIDAESVSAAPADIAAADVALELLDSIQNDPNLDMGVGGTSVFNSVPGTPGRDFQAKVDQAASGAFLSAIQQLRGMGALSNAEGQTATQAITRMNTSTSKEAFLSALEDYKQIVQNARDKAASKVSPVATENDPLGLR